MLHSHTQTFLAQMGPFQDLLSRLIKLLLLFLGELLLMVCKPILDHVFPAWHNYLLIDVADECLDKRRTNFFDSFLEPDIIVKKLSLAGKYAKIDSEIVVLAIDNLDQTIFNVLRDVKDSRQIHDPLLMPARLTDTTNHQCLIVIP